MMRDERIIRELNQTKLVVMYYTLIVTLVFGLVRYLTISWDITNYLVDIFILFIGGLLLLSRLIIFNNGSDERLEQKFEKFANMFLSIMLFGSFFIHFFINAYSLTQETIRFNFTSTFILVGFIILMVQLKKRKIYYHYELFVSIKRKYILTIFKRIFVFGLIFALNILPFIYFNANLLIGGLSVAISWASFSIFYLFFALYEKNHYLESEMYEEGTVRGLSKNASLLYIIPLIFSLISTAVNTYYTVLVFSNTHHSELIEVATIQALLELYSLDIGIVSLITFIIISNHLKRLKMRKVLLNLILIYAISTFIISVANFIFGLFFPLIVAVQNSAEFVDKVLKIHNYINFGLFIYLTVLLIAIAYHLYKRGVSYLPLFYIFIGLPLFTWILHMIIPFGLRTAGVIIIISLISAASSIILYIFMKKHENLTFTYKTNEELETD